MDACCAAGPPVSLNYTPTGEERPVGGVPCYVAAPPSGPRPSAAVVGVYDIFGVTPQFKQVCDRLAAATGCLVVGPDVFRGKPWSLDKFPPKPEDNLLGWIQGYPYEGCVAKDVDAVVAGLKADGVTRFVSLGWCWGASMAVQAAAASPAVFAATAFLHPSLFGREKDLCAPLQVPLATLSTKDDPLETIKEVMDAKPVAAKCLYRRYDGMVHGFCGARGKFDDPEVAKAVGEAIQLVAGFFKAALA